MTGPSVTYWACNLLAGFANAEAHFVYRRVFVLALAPKNSQSDYRAE